MKDLSGSRFGFKYGPLAVCPIGEARRGKIVRLFTPEHELEVYVSDGGRSLRVWDRKAGRELK